MPFQATAMPSFGANADDGPVTPDETLVKAAQAGDPAAFAELYDRYVDSVRGFVAKRVRFGPDREDLVQEIFTRALEELAAGRYERRGEFGDASVRCWLFGGVARRVLVDEVYRRCEDRDAQTAVMVELSRQQYDMVPGEAGATAAPEQPPAEFAERFAALPPHKREVLVHRYFYGRSQPVTAEALGVSVSVVKHRAADALAMLRDQSRSATRPRPGARKVTWENQVNQYRGRVYVARPDGTLGTRNVFGATRDEAVRKLDELCAEIDLSHAGGAA